MTVNPAGMPTGTSTRDGVALLLAAARNDHAAVATLIQYWDLRQAREAAAFCAYTATTQLHARENDNGTPGAFEARLRQIASHLAATNTNTDTDTDTDRL